jgi:hypothetical protein
LKAFKKALLPLKKGGWEGFLGMPFQKAKLIQILQKTFDFSLYRKGVKIHSHSPKKITGGVLCRKSF